MPEYDESEFDNSYLGAAKALEHYIEQTISTSDADSKSSQSNAKVVPKAIDLLVPAGKKSVVLTGPNTGDLIYP